MMKLKKKCVCYTCQCQRNLQFGKWPKEFKRTESGIVRYILWSFLLECTQVSFHIVLSFVDLCYMLIKVSISA